MGKRKSNAWRRRDDGAIEIELTQGQVALIDQGDLDTVLKFRWYAGHHGQGWRAESSSDYKRREGRHLRMHRLILDAPPGMDVDHVNGNGLDNRRMNLRLASRSQNLANQRKQRDKTSSRYKGVSISRQGTWRARICVRGQKRWLGIFESEEEAALAYNRAASEYFGEFARLNEV